MTGKHFSEESMQEHFGDTGKRLEGSCILEEAYEVQMGKLVEPYLQGRRSFGVEAGLYYEFYSHPQPKGTIVISHGYTEACEKFHELIYYMLQEGYQVAVLDHRGHGKSLREVEDPWLVHVENFSCYVRDLHHFVTAVVLPEAGKGPLYLYAHSMGGCIGTLYLEQHPDIFQKAVLNAPMFGINNGSIPDLAAKFLCRGAMLLGKKKQRLFTMGGFDPQEPFERCGCDSLARHNYYLKLRRQHREYQTSCATYCWAYQAIRAGRRAIRRSEASKIRIPVLLFQAAEDAFVRAGEQELFLRRIPRGRKLLVKSRHEIYRTTGERLEAYLAELFAFYREQAESFGNSLL